LEVIEQRSMAKKTADTTSPQSATRQTAAPSAQTAPASSASATALVIDGNWDIVMTPPMGPQQKMIGRFATSGDVLKGTLDSDQGAMDFQGTVSGNKLKWEMKVTKPVSITLKYELVIEGDTLSGKAKLGMFGTAKVSGRRM
jgi:carbon-monoxide dehydrogenase large subunit